MGYLGIKRILDSHLVKYAKNTITQASNLKEKLETLDIRKKEVTVAKLDIVAMYPSIQFLIVKKAVEYFSKDLQEKRKRKLKDA